MELKSVLVCFCGTCNFSELDRTNSKISIVLLGYAAFLLRGLFTRVFFAYCWSAQRFYHVHLLLARGFPALGNKLMNPIKFLKYILFQFLQAYKVKMTFFNNYWSNIVLKRLAFFYVFRKGPFSGTKIKISKNNIK